MNYPVKKTTMFKVKYQTQIKIVYHLDGCVYWKKPVMHDIKPKARLVTR